MLNTLRMLELRASQPVSEWSDTWELGGATFLRGAILRSEGGELQPN